MDHISSDSSTCLSTTTIHAFDINTNVMLLYTDKREYGTGVKNALNYGILSNISDINTYAIDGGTSTLSTKYLYLPDGDVSGIDGYDTSYVFIIGSFSSSYGIHKYSVDTVNYKINSSPILSVVS